MLPYYSPAATGLSPQARLLPFIEQANLDQLIDYSQPLMFGSGPNISLNPAYAGITDIALPVLQCPSESGDPYLIDRDVRWAGGNYLVNIGSGTGLNYCRTATHQPDGLFWGGSKTRFRDITDGTSNTILMAEGLFGGRDAVSTTILTDARRQMKRASGGGGVCTRTGEDLAAAGPNGYVGTRNGAWLRATSSHVTINAFFPPNSSHPDTSHHGDVITSSRSNHPGGVLCSLSDGSVRFVSDSVNLVTWRALFSRAGGEVIADF
jgi:hypothetical protein